MSPYTPAQVATLRAYEAGELGTKAAIEDAGLRDFGDLLIAFAHNDLRMPRPAETPARTANIARATAILQPRLRLAY